LFYPDPSYARTADKTLIRVRFSCTSCDYGIRRKPCWEISLDSSE